ncbi:helix-turn-helix transcriptional regulator [Candidatus Saccharibacteria bacterium]|nr:helix-turn-helix transcriptional regulator [Candidatus Saccharibacteria bacterium]
MQSSNTVNLPIYIARESLYTEAVRDNIPHLHASAIEIIYLTAGELECQANDASFLLRPGDVCFINRGQLHHLYRRSASSVDEHLSLIVDPDYFFAQNTPFSALLEPLLGDAAFTHYKFSASDYDNSAIYTHLLEVEALVAQKSCAYEFDLAARLLQIFRHLYCAYLRPCATPLAIDADLPLQKKMLDYIASHYSETIDVLDIAKSANLSKSKCFRLFKRYTRLTPAAYLNQYRLERAAKLLTQTTHSISSIAHSCGFSQHSYFGKLFLANYHCTPVEYRRALQGPSKK